MRRFYIVIFVLALIHWTPLKGFGSETQNNLPDSSAACLLNAILYVPKDIDAIKSQLENIFLQTVKDGKMRTTAFSRKEILPNSELPVQGYVTGLVIQGSPQLEIQINGQKMDKIRDNADGSVAINNFGNSSFASLGISAANNRYPPAAEAKQPPDRKQNSFFSGFYSFFPEIVGGPICSDTRVDMVLTVDGRTVRMSLLNPGYINLPAERPADGKRGPVVFRYLGSQLQHLENRPADFRNRINAITEGILAVEHALGMKLVSHVNLIDYQAIHDAVTAKRKHDIWFYISSFTQESPAELKSMAEHETIHIYVDSKNLTAKSEIRQSFADLKGYDQWSLERFALVTTGQIRRRPTVNEIDENPFFAFIDERNFQEGRLGGHSHSDLDEFCTSFIHSLMFFDRLKINLDKPIKFRDPSQPPLRLTAAQKATILTTYIHVLEITSKAVAEEDRQDAAVEPAQSLFQQALSRLQNQSRPDSLVSRK
jgi:hypothetical protein